MTAAERAASVGAEYIHTPDFEGVIFPEGYGCVHDYWLFPYWTPSRDLVLAAEARLPAFLRSFPPNHGEPQEDWLQRYSAPLILAKLPQYRRQYSGIVFEDHPMLHMNFFAWGGWGDWVTHFVEVCDGGHDYFQAIYHPERGEFVAFWPNGDSVSWRPTMLRAYHFAAIASLVILCAVAMSLATGDPGPKEPQRITAPIWYEDMMLILSGKEGVALVIFKNDWNNDTRSTKDRGVHYQFRYLGRDSQVEIRGDGTVREKYRHKPTNNPNTFAVVDIEDRLFIEAGSLQLEWSNCMRGRGWIYYVPEKLSVQIGNAKEFSELDLKRFQKR